MRIARPTILLSLALLACAAPAAAGPVANRIYPAPTAPLSLAGLPPGSALVRVRTADGLDLGGIAIAARDGMPTLLVFHGNASSAASTIAWFEPLAARGYGIVAAEYRGYSANPGKPDEAGLFADAAAFYALAKARAGGGPVWVVGHSLGAGAAFGLARRERLDALVTIGAFTRLRAAAPKIARAFLPDDYDNLGAVRLLDEPYLLVHGMADSTVSFREGEALHDAAGTAGKRGGSFAILGADHKPDGRLIALVMEAVASYLRTGRFDPAGLPPTIKLIPFGQSKPLNP
jgi:pimeloyl-ACP methyl ester carboxylesterase